MAAESSDPVAQALAMFNAALRDDNQALAAIWFDKLQVLYKQMQVQAIIFDQQLQAAFQGIPLKQTTDLLALSPETQVATSDNNQAANPANGAVGVAQRAGVGNQPSPEAGFNTTANRQSENTGLVDVRGEPIQFG